MRPLPRKTVVVDDLHVRLLQAGQSFELLVGVRNASGQLLERCQMLVVPLKRHNGQPSGHIRHLGLELVPARKLCRVTPILSWVRVGASSNMSTLSFHFGAQGTCVSASQ